MGWFVMLRSIDLNLAYPLVAVPESVIIPWCEEQPAIRYRIMAAAIRPFGRAGDDDPPAWTDLGISDTQERTRPHRSAQSVFASINAYALERVTGGDPGIECQATRGFGALSGPCGPRPLSPRKKSGSVRRQRRKSFRNPAGIRSRTIVSSRIWQSCRLPKVQPVSKTTRGAVRLPWRLTPPLRGGNGHPLPEPRLNSISLISN